MPDIRPRPSNIDRQERMTPGMIEVRSKDGAPSIYGHGATFNSLTRIDDWFGSYMEQVAPGAFTKTLSDGADVRCLFNHDPNYVLGRTKSGTLTLAEDDIGLAYEATPPDTQWARDLRTTMERGDVDGSSFGFRVIRDKWSTVLDPDGDQKTDLMDCRTVLEVQFYDVSPVTFPAYPDSDSAVRSALLRGGFDVDAVLRVSGRVARGLALRPHDVDHVRAAIDYLRRYLPAESPTPAVTPTPSGHLTPEPIAEPTLPGHSQKLLDRLARLNQSVAADGSARLAALRATA